MNLPEFGTSIDVFPGGYALVENDWLSVQLVHGAVSMIVSADAKIQRLLEIRADISADGEIWAVCKSGATFGGVNRLVLIRPGVAPIVTAFACVASNAVAIKWNVDHFVVWTQHTKTQALRLTYALDGTLLSQFESDAPGPIIAKGGTSQGFLEVVPMPTPSPDEITWMDMRRSIVADGITFNFPLTEDGLLTGQVPSADYISGLYPNGTALARFTAIAQKALLPRLAANPDGTFSIAAAMDNGKVAMAIVPPYPPYQVSVATFAKPMLIAPYWATAPKDGLHSHFGIHDCPGNGEMLMGRAQYGDMLRPRPVIASPDSLDSVPDEQILAMSVAADGGGDLVANLLATRAIPRVAALGLGSAIYTDGTRFDDRIRPLLLPHDWLILQAYRLPHETPETFYARVITEINRIAEWGAPILLALGCSDRGFMSDAELEALMPAHDALLRHPHVHGGLIWAIGRDTGVNDHPDLWPWVEAFAKASPGRPVFPRSSTDPIEPPDPEPPHPQPPQPEPPASGDLLTSELIEGETMADRFAIRNRLTGKFGRVNNTPADGVDGDAAWPFFFDRDAIGVDEQFEVVDVGSDRVLVTADVEPGRRKELREVSFPPGNVDPQTRAKGTQRSWERGQAVALPDGSNIFYRPQQGDHAPHGTPTTIYELVKL